MTQIFPTCSDDCRLENGIEPGLLWLGSRFTTQEREEDSKLEFGASRIQMFERREMTEGQMDQENGDYYDRQR